ncbi:prepilin-type N-terminal cleavage/methylation domain-containing protein [Pseudacidovorax intermedius]|uniref:prepilin-type N-terminal cleavage/methylation domain-containing protein n=1 Tax=Pseudacidovorax intermedius TaxID=433924 RepID=UPI0026F05194|nr:prepilin-type N-terminal cleavage/methylation domain-containing protein [Pseudacidovorax intermedius]
MRNTRRPATSRQRLAGFTLVELSLVLVVISILIGAVMGGMNVYRQAMTQRMYSDFVLGWRAAYLSFVSNSYGIQPGDSTTSPSYAVGGALNTPLCGDALINAMLAQGVSLPHGRAAEMPDRYVYTDKSGTPHEVQVCLETVLWSLPATTVGTFQAVPRHVLRITGLAPSVALAFDAMTDGRIDASFGEFREAGSEAGQGAASTDWSQDETASMRNADEGESVELTAYLLVGR